MMADVNSSLASSALAKISSGTPLDKLAPTEKQAIGALPPGALQAAMSSRIAPKPSAIPGAYPSAEKAPNADKTLNAGTINPIKSTEPTIANQPSMMPAAKPDFKTLLAQGVQGMVASGAPGGSAPGAPNIGATPVEASLGYGTAGYTSKPLPPDTISAASPPSAPSVEPMSPALPAPPPALTTPTPKAETPTPIANNAGGYPAYTPASAMPSIPKGMDKAKLADIIGAVMDAVGGGMRAYGGTNAPTKFMREGELAMQTKAATQQAKAQADIGYNQAVKMMPLEVQTAAETAKATGDWDTFYAIAKQKGVQDMEIAKIKAAAQAGLGYNPYAGAVNAVKGPK